MIIDLHADILAFLAESVHNSCHDNACRASIGQLRAGKVAVQTFPMYVPTTKTQSFRKGLLQARLYRNLPRRYPEDFSRGPIVKNSPTISTRLSIENGSCLFSEDEPFENGNKRLKMIATSIEKPLYMSLTWHYENRFGGGNLTNFGLKKDGERLLDSLAAFCYAVDLSHTSDELARDILRYVSRHKLPLKVLASHSNFRACHPEARNLPDEFAEKIAAHGGLIGLNFIRAFLGKDVESFFSHVEYGLKKGLRKSLALGSDFFATSILEKLFPNHGPYFFDGLDNASCFTFIEKELNRRFGKEIAADICFQNALNFLNTLR